MADAFEDDDLMPCAINAHGYNDMTPVDVLMAGPASMHLAHSENMHAY